MRRVFAIALLLLPLSAVSDRTAYLIDDALICSVKDTVCIRGTLSYTHRTRILELRGRVVTAAGPGLLIVQVVGKDRYGATYSSALEVQLRGKLTEIVDHRVGTNTPEVSEWAVSRIEFRPGEDKNAR